LYIIRDGEEELIYIAIPTGRPAGICVRHAVESLQAVVILAVVVLKVVIARRTGPIFQIPRAKALMLTTRNFVAASGRRPCRNRSIGSRLHGEITLQTIDERRRKQMNPLRACAFAILSLAAISLAAGTAAAGCPAQPYGDKFDATQPINLGQLKYQLLDYKCFGGYDRDVKKALLEAQVHVERRAGDVENPALVLDIDETSLSNWPRILANDFGYIPSGTCDRLPDGPCGDHAWELKGQAEAIAPTLDLFKAAKAKGVAIFFITGRGEAADLRDATEKNLRAAGYDGWKAVLMRPSGVYKSVQEYKTAKRIEIEGQKFFIIANVGDQASDLDGGHADRVFRVPNPFYFIP
jgi:HAD superfamily, subfamily IIIB (Acid phosphatase)